MNEVKLNFFNHIVVGQSMVFYELIFLIDTFEVSRREQSIANLPYICTRMEIRMEWSSIFHTK